MAGEYVWTGFDYLGEPTPYYSEWPSRSSYFGIVDIAGLPKNRYYLYQAQWTTKPVLHIFPHWNWEDMEGSIVPIHVYTNAYAVELFVNNRSYGKQTVAKNSLETNEDQIKRFRLMWQNVVYKPGIVVAVAYDENGNRIQESCVRTAGIPVKLLIEADRTQLIADGEDLLYVTATITDENGVPCPHANTRMFFEAKGCLEVLTTDNGDQREVESFWRSNKKAHSGMCVVCCRTIAEQKGEAIVTVRGEGLIPASLSIMVN